MNQNQIETIFVEDSFKKLGYKREGDIRDRWRICEIKKVINFIFLTSF